METRLRSARGMPRSIHDERSALAVPLRARYLAQTDTAYLVGEPGGTRTAHVQKLRAATVPYPSPVGRSAGGVGVLRLSWLALAGAVCGGVAGVLLGMAIILVALARLASLSRRVRHSRQRRSRGVAVPETVTIERLRLLAALGQGVLAVFLGTLVLALVRGPI
ncbi:MAG TPA: hypothetical protein VLJ14_10565 [Ktedonobacterales bacterium]|nr:hypothetical protein [Ktedonobacterales bacterium]